MMKQNFLAVFLVAVFNGSSLLASPPPGSFPLYETIALGKQKLTTSLTPQEAKKLMSSPECKAATKPVLVLDKFSEIERNLVRGKCWTFRLMGQGQAVSNPIFADGLDEMEDLANYGDEILPQHGKSDKLTLVRKGHEITITKPSPGWTARFQVITRGRFSGKYDDELLIRKSMTVEGGTYDDCEILTVAKMKSSGKIILVDRKNLGRCA